ncbi:MAG TPA: hypothetical protein VKU19_21775 [Bryobacteraceae bacterium]|nr:hypothetical protein [Bryobacteraceae bacterium]
MPETPKRRGKQVAAAAPTVPRWFRPLLLALAAVLLLGWFSPEIADPDFWWHLKTGQYIAEQHTLPVPDPFAYTTYLGSPAYAGEEHTRYFNLTHEWLAQVLLFAVYRAGGFGAVVAVRAVLLTLVCGLVGLIVWRRTGGGFYRALGAAIAAAGVLSAFAADRPFVITFLFLAAMLATLEWAGRVGRPLLGLLPLLMVAWANCHGGYFLGWVVLGAWAAEALWLRLRKHAMPGDRMLWLASAIAVAVSGLNPSGFRIVQILSYYRGSYLTSRLQEWAPTPWWPLRWHTVLLVAAVAVLLWARKQVRISDWLLFGAFTIAAITAHRNVALIGLLFPILIASYTPAWKQVGGIAWQFAAATLLIAGLALGIAGGSFFQFRMNPWKWPAGAADFLLTHHVTAPMFNSYEYGGYLMWRLWPQERVFIDGRALNESVFADYARILYNHDESGGKSGSQLLDQYGVQAIVMNGFEFASGNVYLLAPSLADPQQTEWKLVYSDAQAMIFMRHPPAGVDPLNSLAAIENLEAECDLHLEHEPQYPRCARSLGQVLSKVGDFARARRWIGRYLGLIHERDPEAEDAYQHLVGAGQ